MCRLRWFLAGWVACWLYLVGLLIWQKQRPYKPPHERTSARGTR